MDAMKIKTGKILLLIVATGLLFGLASTVFAENRNVIKIARDLTIEEGTQIRNAIVIGGQITVDGHVENHVVVIGGSIVLTNTAVIGGNTISIGGVVAMGRGAEVQGDIIEINLDTISEAMSNALSDEWEGWSWIFAMVSLFIFVGFLAFSLLIVHFIPTPIRIVSKAVREIPLKVVTWGIGGLVMVVPLFVLLAISVIGIVLIPLEVALVLCAVIIGFIAVSQLIGEALFTFLKRHDQNMMLRETIWGLIILWVIGWIPFLGLTIKVLAIVFGMGGVLVTRFGTRSYNR